MFSYICLIIKSSFTQKVQSITFNKNDFTDLLDFTLIYENILNLFVLNILIYIISVIDIISKMSKEFKFITKSIFEVFNLILTNFQISL